MGESVYLPGLLSGARILMSLMPSLGFLLALNYKIALYRPDVVDSHYRVNDVSSYDLLAKYDFIIIGAGSAGSVVANRLSENPDWTVLLLEAGNEEPLVGDLPLMMPVLQLSKVDWQFTTVADKRYCLAMKDGICNWPRGKVLGGSSSINAMLYARGNKKDFDYWENLGNPGWSYEKVLPYFKKSEDMRIPEFKNDYYHGTGGYLTIEEYKYKQPLTEYFKKAAKELGYDIVDVNGKSQTGFMEPHGTLRDGLRCSTSKAFLRPASKRKNLHISLDSFVEKILIDKHSKNAFGVSFKKGDESQVVFAKKEIILSAGAIQSPQILMLSGVGDVEHLVDKDIEPLVNLPGVGKNMQDHVAMGGNPYLYEPEDGKNLGLNLKNIFTDETINDFVHNYDGPLYNLPECEVMGFVNTKYANYSHDYPDVQLVLGAYAENTDGGIFGKRDLRLADNMFAAVYEDILYKPTYSAVPLLLRPKSRGYILLKDKNPYSKPLIYPNYFDDPYDLKVLIEGARIAYSISQTPTMKKLKASLNPRFIPGCDHFEPFSDKHLECQARHHTLTIFHPSGTCKMGPHIDPYAVVDARLRVHGVYKLRVADASIMPTIVSANTNAGTIMIGEKVSDMIKEDWLGGTRYILPPVDWDHNSNDMKIGKFTTHNDYINSYSDNTSPLMFQQYTAQNYDNLINAPNNNNNKPQYQQPTDFYNENMMQHDNTYKPDQPNFISQTHLNDEKGNNGHNYHHQLKFPINVDQANNGENIYEHKNKPFETQSNLHMEKPFIHNDENKLHNNKIAQIHNGQQPNGANLEQKNFDSNFQTKNLKPRVPVIYLIPESELHKYKFNNVITPFVENPKHTIDPKLLIKFDVKKR